jgi:hypothetical protein
MISPLKSLSVQSWIESSYLIVQFLSENWIQILSHFFMRRTLRSWDSNSGTE